MCYVTQWGVGVSDFTGKKRYIGVWVNVISVMRRCPTMDRKITLLEWPHMMWPAWV